ncbi:hypothetical protein DDZ13_05480 [Coraliomargarita sinensis]|uniref:Uncharacterized protein n=2 Tax=Coraliomargarita sinensis TaxID=2174842 RepID=A0A317ZKV1_9BACT|nr:hypothetical protein DDZ13_05480 [Coraliomargarita sinensis]
MNPKAPKIYFSDIFNVSQETLSEYGAFNVSPIVDLPLFVDPFLLFTSSKPEYQSLHEQIIQYLRYLRDLSIKGNSDKGILKDLYCFKEVHQNCLGFCLSGNRGAGLGMKFASSLNLNLNNLFREFGNEQVTQGSHLEKLTLIRAGVGKDNISDFTTNLIKGYLLRYTEKFALEHIDPALCKKVRVARVDFNYEVGVWIDGEFTLPWLQGDYVLLTPEDILTKDDTWINKEDLRKDFPRIREAISNDSLRGQVDRYFQGILPRDHTQKDLNEAVEKVLLKFPALIDHFIRNKEDRGDEAVHRSFGHVRHTEEVFVKNLSLLASILQQHTEFYISSETTLEESKRKIDYLKQVIENQDGYRLFYDDKGKKIQREKDLQIAFKLVWEGSPSSADAEVNNGRGPVDFKISRGSLDATLVEFKLASNTQIEKNLQNQVEIYEAANRTTQSYKVILFFTQSDEAKVKRLIKKLKIPSDAGVILIDARRDNKPSASKASDSLL